MDYVIGVDAGGTKTSAKAYSLDGQALYTHIAGPGNGTLGFEPAAENIALAIEGCQQQVAGVCRLLCVGMAGLDPLDGPPRMEKLLTHRFHLTVKVMNDALLALTAAHGAGDGLLVIAGTGSIVYGRQDGRLLRRGGWGHLLGDTGSGYDIAVSAVKLVLAREDDGLPPIPLTQALLSAVGVDRLRALVEYIYRQNKEGIAALVPAVVQAALQGDEQASEILERAGQSLAEAAAALNHRLGLQHPQIALAGSILEHVQPVRTSFLRSIGEHLPAAEVHPETPEPQRAALWIYESEYKETIPCI